MFIVKACPIMSWHLPVLIIGIRIHTLHRYFCWHNRQAGQNGHNAMMDYKSGFLVTTKYHSLSGLYYTSLPLHALWAVLLLPRPVDGT